MNFTLEGILVGALLILPGFLASSVQRFFIKQRGSEGEWVAVSALRSLGLNAVTALMLILAVKVVSPDVRAVGLDTLVQDIRGQLQLLSVSQVGSYLLLLYVMAFVYGLFRGLLWKYAPRFFFTRGWTPVSPYPDVWTDALDSEFGSKKNRKLKGHDEQKCPWVRIALNEKAEVLGMLTRSSVDIDRDKPFEILLEAVHIREAGGRWQSIEVPDGAKEVGIHLRIEPKTPVLVLSAPKVWRPPLGSGADNHRVVSQTGSVRKGGFLMWHAKTVGS